MFEKSHPDLNQQRIVITGGTGSLGRALLQNLFKTCSPELVTVIARDELKHLELTQQGITHPSLRFVVADVRFKERLREIVQGHSILIHTAAIRDLGLCETKPWDAIQVNVNGTQNIFEAAMNAGVEKALLISTDKVVNPKSVYGTTKLLAEKIFLQMQSSNTKFSCIRFGNLIGSHGGFIPKLLQQKREGFVHVTDPKMSRFGMPINLAAHHVLKCLHAIQGGEIFVPKSPSYKLMDLVGAVAPNAKVNFIGIQNGERLHDVLISLDEAPDTQELKDCYVVRQGSYKKDLPSGFVYESNTNSWFLTRSELGALVNAFFPERGFSR